MITKFDFIFINLWVLYSAFYKEIPHTDEYLKNSHENISVPIFTVAD